MSNYIAFRVPSKKDVTTTVIKDVATNVTKLQVHNIVSSNKVISQVSFPRGLDKTSTKIIVNLQLFGKSIKL